MGRPGAGEMAEAGLQEASIGQHHGHAAGGAHVIRVGRVTKAAFGVILPMMLASGPAPVTSTQYSGAWARTASKSCCWVTPGSMTA